MKPSDERLDPVMNFVVKSFRLNPEKWRLSVSNEDNLVTLNSFFMGKDHGSLFICEEEDEEEAITEEDGPEVETVPEANSKAVIETTSDAPTPPPLGCPPVLRFTLGFPRNVVSKVVCVIKPSCEAVTKDTVKNLRFMELPGNDVLSLMMVLTEDIFLPLIGNRENCFNWPEGMSEEVLKQVEILKNQACVLKAQTQGCIFLPQPTLHKDSLNLEKGLKQEEDDQDNIGVVAPSSCSQSEHLQPCDGTIIDWAELVGEFLEQDSSDLIFEQTRPLPEKEFNFWERRLQNLVSIDKQLKSARAQQVAAIVENAQSVYATTLEQICSHVQDALIEAEDIVHNIKPLQKLLEPMLITDYSQLRDQVETVLEEVRLLWTRSQFYCKTHRIVVLLQEICNLFIELSRSFLGRVQVLRGLVSDPAAVLESVCLCIATLKRLKECFRGCRAQLDAQDAPKWDFPSLLIFVHLDQFLERLEKIREVYCVTLDMSHLEKVILSGINGKAWTGLVHELYNHFQHHVTVLAESVCDATDSKDQEFPELWAQFHSQVHYVESCLVTVFRRALETCTTSASAGKIVLMFGPVLRHPLILNKLQHQFDAVWNMIWKEVDYAELLAQRQIQSYEHSQVQSKVYINSKFTSSEISILIWAHQLEQRVQHSYHNHLIVQAVEPSGAQLISGKCQRLKEMLQDFSASVRTQWTQRLEKDCALILQQPIIKLQQSGILEVCCGPKLEAVLRELRFVNQDQEVRLHPEASRLFSIREDLTVTYLSLSKMRSCYNVVVSSVDPVELPLIHAQLQDLNHDLSGLQSWSWGAEGLLQEVQRHRATVVSFCQMIGETREITAAIKQITEGWGKIQLLQRQEDGLLRGGASETSQLQLSRDAQDLILLIQENRSSYQAEESSDAWLSYLDHIDDLVQSGLVQLLQTALSFLTESMKSPGPPLLRVVLSLQPQGSRFSVAGGVLSVEESLQAIVSELYTASDLVPRISTHRHTNYQPSLKQSPILSSLEQNVRSNAKEVSEKAEDLRAELDMKYGHLWTSSRPDVMREFLTYGRQLGPDEQDVVKASPTLKEFRREIHKLQGIQSELSAINDVTVLRGWLEVDLRPFRDSVMSLTDEWSHMFTEHLLRKAEDLQTVALEREDQADPAFPLTETWLLLEMSGVELPPSLHC